MNFLGPLSPMADRLTRMASSFRLTGSSGIKTDESPPPDEVMRALEAIIEAGYGTIKTAFDKVDLNGDGYLSADELESALRKQGVAFTKEQITAVIKSGNGSTGLREEKETLSEAEFLAMVRRLRRTQSPERKPKTSRPAVEKPGRPPWVGPMDHGWDERPSQPRVQLPPSPPAPATRTSPPRAKTPPVERTTTNNKRGPQSAPPANRRGGRKAEPDLTPSQKAASGAIDLETRLQDIIGLAPIKEKVRALKDTLVKRAYRKEVGAPLVDVGPLHMIFTGNPGCGKTSIARLLAEMLFELNAVQTTKFVEVQRTDLVATHIGQTGPKARAKIDEAKGGILFVDEAYRLTSTSDKDFGTEALEEIMKDLTSGDPLVIAAGYPNDMAKFLEANEGLRRRFPVTFDFPDFSVEELAQMAALKVTSQGFELGADVTNEVMGRLLKQNTDAAWRKGLNGGVAESLARGAMKEQDARLDPTKMKLEEYKAVASKIELCDVAAAASKLQSLSA